MQKEPAPLLFSPKDHSSEQTLFKIKAYEKFLRIRYGQNDRIGEVEDVVVRRIKHDSTDNSPVSAEKTVELIGEKLTTIKMKNF